MLTTDRLILRYFEMSDCKRIAELCNDLSVTQFLPLPNPYPLELAESWVAGQEENRKNNKTYDFAIVLRETNDLIGSISLMVDASNNFAEIGYWLDSTFWGKGFVTEACKRIVEFAFEDLKLHKVFAKHYVENPASGKVMQKVGMKCVATLQDHALKNGHYHDVKLYELINR